MLFTTDGNEEVTIKKTFIFLIFKKDGKYLKLIDHKYRYDETIDLINKLGPKHFYIKYTHI